MQINLLSQQKFQIEMQNDLQIDLQTSELQNDSFNQHGLQIDLQSVLLCVSDFYF